jgi:hypothetical protein
MKFSMKLNEFAADKMALNNVWRRILLAPGRGAMIEPRGSGGRTLH